MLASIVVRLVATRLALQKATFFRLKIIINMRLARAPYSGE